MSTHNIIANVLDEMLTDNVVRQILAALVERALEGEPESVRLLVELDSRAAEFGWPRAG